MTRCIALIALLCLGCADGYVYVAPDAGEAPSASSCDAGATDDGPNFLTDCSGCYADGGWCPSDCTDLE